jgi:hypothetical protein
MVTAINPYFIPSNNAWQKGGIISGILQQFTACCCTLFCLILHEKPRNKFCQHTSHSKIVRQYCLTRAKWKVKLISNPLIFKCWFSRINSMTWSTVLLLCAVMAGLCVNQQRWKCGHFLNRNTIQMSWTNIIMFLRMLVSASHNLPQPFYQVSRRI